jgi:outer membrane biosynthesis protein TonB
VGDIDNADVKDFTNALAQGRVCRLVMTNNNELGLSIDIEHARVIRGFNANYLCSFVRYHLEQQLNYLPNVPTNGKLYLALDGASSDYAITRKILQELFSLGNAWGVFRCGNMAIHFCELPDSFHGDAHSVAVTNYDILYNTYYGKDEFYQKQILKLNHAVRSVMPLNKTAWEDVRKAKELPSFNQTTSQVLSNLGVDPNVKRLEGGPKVTVEDAEELDKGEDVWENQGYVNDQSAPQTGLVPDSTMWSSTKDTASGIAHAAKSVGSAVHSALPPNPLSKPTTLALTYPEPSTSSSAPNLTNLLGNLISQHTNNSAMENSEVPTDVPPTPEEAIQTKLPEEEPVVDTDKETEVDATKSDKVDTALEDNPTGTLVVKNAVVNESTLETQITDNIVVKTTTTTVEDSVTGKDVIHQVENTTLENGEPKAFSSTTQTQDGTTVEVQTKVNAEDPTQHDVTVEVKTPEGTTTIEETVPTSQVTDLGLDIKADPETSTTEDNSPPAPEPTKTELPETDKNVTKTPEFTVAETPKKTYRLLDLSPADRQAYLTQLEGLSPAALRAEGNALTAKVNTLLLQIEQELSTADATVLSEDAHSMLDNAIQTTKTYTTSLIAADLGTASEEIVQSVHTFGALIVQSWEQPIPEIAGDSKLFEYIEDMVHTIERKMMQVQVQYKPVAKSEPKPEPVPEPVVDVPPTPQIQNETPTPEPVPAKVPEPVQEPTPVKAPEPVPIPVPAPQPAQVPVPAQPQAPVPVPQPTPVQAAVPIQTPITDAVKTQMMNDLFNKTASGVSTSLATPDQAAATIQGLQNQVTALQNLVAQLSGPTLPDSIPTTEQVKKAHLVSAPSDNKRGMKAMTLELPPPSRVSKSNQPALSPALTGLGLQTPALDVTQFKTMPQTQTELRRQIVQLGQQLQEKIQVSQMKQSSVAALASYQTTLNQLKDQAQSVLKTTIQVNQTGLSSLQNMANVL